MDEPFKLIESVRLKHPKGFLKKLLIMTGVVWSFYAGLLPIYFYFVFDWGWAQIIKWWLTGTPVEFILAYPLSRIIIYLEPKVNNMIHLGIEGLALDRNGSP